MNEPLFAFLAHGVATASTAYRAGARHALILYAKGPDMDAARSLAVAGATENGWEFVVIRREKEFEADIFRIGANFYEAQQ